MLKFFLEGVTVLAPLKVSASTISAPALPMTPCFFFITESFYTLKIKNGDLRKNIEVHKYRFDRDMLVLSKEILIIEKICL